MLRQRGRVAGCLSQSVLYQNGKTYLKPFQPSGSPIILVYSDSGADTQFQGNPFSAGSKYTGVRKIGDFRRKSLFISETVREADSYYGTLIVVGAGLNGIIFDDLE